jgi:hypothetical protein
MTFPQKMKYSNPRDQKRSGLFQRRKCDFAEKINPIGVGLLEPFLACPEFKSL